MSILKGTSTLKDVATSDNKPKTNMVKDTKATPEQLEKHKSKLLDLYGDERTLKDYGLEEHKELWQMLENKEDISTLQKQAYERHQQLLDSELVNHSKKLQGLDHEEAIIFDENGKILDHKKGNVGSVQFDKATARSYKGQNLTHNHPYDEYGTRLFSVEDIDFADNNGLSSITTIDNDGVVRVLYRDKYLIPDDNDHFTGMLSGKYKHIPTKEKEQWLIENAQKYGWKYDVIESRKILTNSNNGGIMRLNSLAGPMREVYGSAESSNPSEVKAFLKEIADNGVELVRSENEKLAYSPGIRRGMPGKLYISQDASYSAWCHEIQHMRDDKADGWSVMRILANPNERYKREEKAYQIEIDLALKAGRKDIANRLKENLAKERELIYGI